MCYQMIKEIKLESKCDPKDLFLDGYDYSVWSKMKKKQLIMKN